MSNGATSAKNWVKTEKQKLGERESYEEKWVKDKEKEMELWRQEQRETPFFH